VRRAIAIVASLNAFAARLSALLSTLPGVDFPGQSAAAVTEPPAPGRVSPLDPRRGGRARGRRLILLLVVVAAVALTGGAAWAFLTAGSTPGSSSQGVAASVDQVTGLALGAGGVTPTADPDVALAWNATTLSNGHAVDGYVVRRYTGPTPTVVCTPGVAHCTDTAVPDGTYTYGVTATLESWTGPESSPISVTVDRSAPTITGEPQSPSANASPQFTFSHDTYSTFECRVDGGSFAPCTSPDALSGLSDGPHTFRVEALDANNVPTHVAAYTWTVDTSPPVIEDTLSDPSANTAPSLSFTHSSYASFECSLDGSPFAACSSPDALTGLGNGPHTFQVEALDADGAATPAASYTWTVDASPPSITAKPTGHSANPNPSFSYSHAQVGYTFRCSLDGAAYGACTSPTAYSGLADGSHELDIEAVDGDGVVTTAAVYDWTIDTSPPTITSTSGMIAGGTYASQSASFTLGHAFYTSFQCYLDGGSFADCGGSGGDPAGLWPSTFQATSTDCGSFDRDGNNFCYAHDNGVELGVRFTTSEAVDIVGVRIYRTDSGPVTGSLWLDGTRLAGPTAFAGTATHDWQDVMFASPVPVAPGHTYVASYFAPTSSYAFEYQFFTDGSTTVGPITALQAVAGSPNGVYCYGGCFPTDTFRDTNYWVTPLWVASGGGSGTFGSLADGLHTVTARALDGDGYATQNGTFSWTVEHAAPTIASHPDALTSSTSAGFGFSESPYSHFECKLDGDAFAACDTGTASYSGLGDGSHTFTVHAVDSIGGTTADQTFTWTVDTTPPAVTLTDVNGSTVTFPFSTTDDVTSLGGACGTAPGDSATVHVTIGGSPADPATATCTGGTWLLTLTTPLSAADTYVVAATQSDSAGNTGSSGDETIDRG